MVNKPEAWQQNKLIHAPSLKKVNIAPGFEMDAHISKNQYSQNLNLVTKTTDASATWRPFS